MSAVSSDWKITQKRRCCLRQQQSRDLISCAEVLVGNLECFDPPLPDPVVNVQPAVKKTTTTTTLVLEPVFIARVSNTKTCISRL